MYNLPRLTFGAGEQGRHNQIVMGNALNNTNLGGFPKEYNPRIHGAYQADRYYGTRTYLIDGVHRIYTIPVFV